MKRVLAIGLDAVDEADLESRLAAGEMPHLAALRERGTWCPLAMEPVCCAEHPWSDFVTGLEPAHLGRWTPVTFDPTTYGYVYTGAPTHEPFWAQGDQAVVVAFDVPSSALARDLRGVHVVDWATHEPMYPRCSSPTGLLGDLDARFGENAAVGLEYGGTWNDEAWLEAYGASLVTSAALRAEVIEHVLATTPDWRLAVVGFSEFHQLAHHAWHGVDADSVLHQTPTATVGRRVLAEVGAALDEAVGRLAADLGPDDVLVVFSPKGNEARCDLASNTLVPELLHRLAFGEPFLHQPDTARWARRGRPPVVLPGGMNFVGAMHASVSDHPGRRLRHRGRRAAFAAADAVARGPVGRLRVRRRQRPRGPWAAPDPATLAPVSGDLLYDEWYVGTWYRPWWPRMSAFVLPSFSDLHVRINVAGREAEGKVAVADYEPAVDEVERVLRACTNPRTGHPLVAEVQRPRGSDPFAEVGLPADLVVSWAEDTDALEHPDVGVVGPYPAWRTGGHRARGFALLAGGGIGHDRLDGHRLVDLPATLLDLAGIDPQRPLDGTVLPLPPPT